MKRRDNDGSGQIGLGDAELRLALLAPPLAALALRREHGELPLRLIERRRAASNAACFWTRSELACWAFCSVPEPCFNRVWAL